MTDEQFLTHKKKMILYIVKETNRWQLRSIGRENDRWTVSDSTEKKTGVNNSLNRKNSNKKMTITVDRQRKWQMNSFWVSNTKATRRQISLQRKWQMKSLQKKYIYDIFIWFKKKYQDKTSIDQKNYFVCHSTT